MIDYSFSDMTSAYHASHVGEDGTRGCGVMGLLGGYVAAGYGWVWLPSDMVAVILLPYQFLSQ